MESTTPLATMEDWALMTDDWQLEQSLGLTLFDDAVVRPVDESTNLKSVFETADVLSFEDLLSAQTDHLADPLGEEWLEGNASIENMLDSLVQDAKAMEEEPPAPASSSDITEVRHDILRSLIEEGIGTSAPSSPEVQVAPTIDFGALVSLDSSQDVPMSPIHITDMDGIMHSPLSAEDVESLISGSEPSSPQSSLDTSSTSVCSELEAMLVGDSTKANGKSRTKTTPYSKSRSERSAKSKVKTVSDTEDLKVEFMSKKDKKKLQNKNAAIRYRMKKKAEADSVKGEEQELENTNKELHDKVDQLTREIQYMKDLMAEVYKAKGLLKS